MFPKKAAAQVDLVAALARRWLRYWQTPYLGTNKHTPFCESLIEDPLAIQAQREREKLRLLCRLGLPEVSGTHCL